MASSTFLLSLGITFCFIALVTQAATVTYNFNITRVTANPDGAFDRPTIGINGKWPIPRITANVGDRVVVNVNNQLGNESTSLHFHGLYMRNTPEMDGPADVTQCPIPPGSSFTYDFTVNQPGTYWYHSHVIGQYPSGLRGPLIVNDPNSPFKDQYDEEIILTLSDWYHGQMADLIASFVSVANPTGAEPVPNAALLNDTQNLSVNIKPGKTYLVRMINMAAFAAQYVWFEDHSFRIVEVDGIYTEPADANMIYITAAQRYSFLLTTKKTTDANFAFVGSMDTDLFDQVPDSLNPNVTGWLVYDSSKPLPDAALLPDAFEPFDDFTLVPKDGEKLFDKVDYSITLNFVMDNLGDGANYAFFNDKTYVRPKVPTLYSALSAGDLANDVSIYGSNTNAFVLNQGDVVEIVVNSADPGKHPFHLHGHAFQAVVRSDEDAGEYDARNVTYPDVPMRRDTFMVNPGGNIVLRFMATNPARVWLFHCHLEWHMVSGLVATLIEAPLELQKTLTIPDGHLKACQAQGMPTTGNAAGNSKDWFDLTGENQAVAPLPAGFTSRGIVALVFSCISAALGVAFIAWYGVGDIKAKGASGRTVPIGGLRVQ